MKRLFALLVVWGLLMTGAGPAGAQEESTVRGLGMGNALTASAAGSGALFYNPAGLSTVRAYTVETFYQFAVQRQGHLAHASVVDSITSKWVHAGLFYDYFRSRPEVFEPAVGRSVRLRKQRHETGLALSVPFANMVSLGVSIRYLHLETLSRAPSDEDPSEAVDATVEKKDTVGLDAGAHVSFGGGFALGVAGRNLVPTHSIDAPMTLSVGAAYAYHRLFLVTSDLVLDFNTPERRQMVGVRAGAEFFIKGMFALRAGTWYDGWPQSVYVTGGFAYVSPKVSVELGLAQQADGGIETQFGLSVRLFFNQM